MVRTWESRSSVSPPFTRMPCSAARPVATRIAVGVARPSAQGHAMISTVTNATEANSSAGWGPKSNHSTNAAMATTSTTGTNTPATVSASRWTGALAVWASSTIRMICPSAVSLPTRVARNTTLPVVLTVPPITSSPGLRDTGRGSPVSIDSSTADAPDSTTPSTGMRSPGRTTTSSPTATVSTATSCSRPSRRTSAVRDRSLASRRIASEVRPLARASNRRPSRMSAMIADTAS
jgi:hypothetical protein